MNIYIHCGNFKTLELANENKRKHEKKKLRKDFIASLATGDVNIKYMVRKRQTSMDKEKEPYEVLLVFSPKVV